MTRSIIHAFKHSVILNDALLIKKSQCHISLEVIGHRRNLDDPYVFTVSTLR